MSEQKFRAELRSVDGRVRLYVPFDPHAVWGKKRTHRVTGTLAGAPFSGSLGARGGELFMPVNKALQQSAGVSAGDVVDVTMQPDEGERKEELPADLASAMNGSLAARRFFNTLSPFYRTQWIQWIESAKKAETRTDRIAKAIAALESGKKQR